MDRLPVGLNTTELLLIRLDEAIVILKELNDEYDWDPATFTVTVIIGLLATTLAILAIGQGFVAAGPGRLKSSHYAIGPWSITQQTKFKWEEWRFRTTVETPIIRFLPSGNKWRDIDEVFSSENNDHCFVQGVGMSDAREEDCEYPWYSRWIMSANHQHARLSLRSYMATWLCSTHQRNSKSKELNEYFPASWLKLLTILKIDNVELWGTEQTGPDYIPAELPAAPAYGSIRDVSILALLATEGNAVVGIDNATSFPFIRCPSMTFTFRDHPLLGVTGFLDTFAIATTNTSRQTTEMRSGHHQDFPEILSLAYGFVALHGKGGRAILTEGSVLHRKLITNDRLNSIAGLASHETVMDFQRACFPQEQDHTASETYFAHGHGPDIRNQWHFEEGQTLDDRTDSVLNRANGTFNRPRTTWSALFALAMAQNPRNPPHVFPRKYCRFSFLQQCVIIQSRLWTKSCEHRPDGPNFMCDDCVDYVTAGATAHRKQSRGDDNGPALELNPGMLLNCLKAAVGLVGLARTETLAFPAESVGFPSDIRRDIHKCIRDIDAWVLASRQTKAEWFKTAWVLCDVAADVADLRAEWIILHDLPQQVSGIEEGNQDFKADKPTLDDVKQAWARAKAEVLRKPFPPRNIYPEAATPLLESLLRHWDFDHCLPTGHDLPYYPLADLMIHRIILMSVLLSSATDSSLLLNDLYDRVVPIF